MQENSYLFITLKPPSSLYNKPIILFKLISFALRVLHGHLTLIETLFRNLLQMVLLKLLKDVKYCSACYLDYTHISALVCILTKMSLKYLQCGISYNFHIKCINSLLDCFRCQPLSCCQIEILQVADDLNREDTLSYA